MNRSYSKIRHIQEANRILENRLLNEVGDEPIQTLKPSTNIDTSKETPFPLLEPIPLSTVKGRFKITPTLHTQKIYHNLLNTPKLVQTLGVPAINSLKTQINSPSFLDSLSSKLEEKGLEAEIEMDQDFDTDEQKIVSTPILSTTVTIPKLDIQVNMGLGKEGLSYVGLGKTWTLGN
jgi:hypothetical protein